MADTDPTYNSIVNYDYLLGASLPDPSAIPSDLKTSYENIVSHDYNTRGKLPTLKQGSEDNFEYDNVFDHDFIVNKEESNMLEAVRFLEDLIEKIHPLNLKISAQNRQLKAAIVELQAEKQVLLSSPENKDLRKVLELKQEAENTESRLTARIIQLADELDKERQKSVFQRGLDTLVRGRATELEQTRTENAQLLSENRRLKEENRVLKQKLENK